jgi:histidine triad (HIT) family protein
MPGMADPDCIFCKIVSGELPSHKIDEDGRTIAFMDINPWTRGHALVIPKEHSRNLFDIETGDLAATAAGAQRLARKMRDRLRCAGVNVLQSSEPAAMQTVFHFHLHVIPRYSDDGLRLPAHPQPAEHEELAGLAEELRD